MAFSQTQGSGMSLYQRLYRAISIRIKRKLDTHIFSRIQKHKYTSKHISELNSILESKMNIVKGSIIYPPFVDWNIPLFARYHHLAIHLSRLGYLFFYCTGNYAYDSIKGFQEVENNLYLTNRYDILRKRRTKGWIIISSTNPNISVTDIKRFKKSGINIIYDYIDEMHTEISGSINHILEERHRLITADIVDLVLTVSAKLYDEMIERFPKEKVMLHQNGVEYEHFHVERKIEECPEDMKSVVEAGKPIIGYYGALARWIDYDLINFIAMSRPDWNIVIIGYDYDQSMLALSKLENIICLGTKDYRELPGYGIWFDAAIIPFREGDVAKSTSPLKLYEYMAMNKPVVVTKDLLECYQYKGVFVARDHNDFLVKLEEALKIKDDAAHMKLIDEEAQSNTWIERAAVLDKAMGSSQYVIARLTK